ncbi:reductive dehalogenase [Chloroflexota bacterium]
MQNLYDEGILAKGSRLGHLPMEKLKRVEQPTTHITGSIKRFDEREHGFNRALRGDFGPLSARERPRFVQKFPISSALADMTGHLASVVDGPIAQEKAPIPEDPQALSRHIKQLGYFLRADVIGICELPQYAVYSYCNTGNKPIELNHKYAIVILIDQDFETMRGSTGKDWISATQSFLSYSTSGFIACIIANYIRKLGYPARAHHARNYQVVVPPLLLMSGTGEMSRAGIVLNPFLGTRFKAAVVTTDLPLIPDKPIDFGLQDFCEKCLKCAVDCPSNAISTGGKFMHNGYEHWEFDADRCTQFRIINQGGSSCGRCIKVCPWNKPEGLLHDTTRWMIKNAPFLNKFVIKMDDIRGYGKQDKRYKWWFDLEDVDGAIRIPDQTH